MAKDSEHKLDKTGAQSKSPGSRGNKSTGSIRQEDPEEPKISSSDVDRRIRVDSLSYGDLFEAAGRTFTYEGIAGDIAKVVLMTTAKVGGGKTITYGIERLEFPLNTLVLKK